MECLFAFVIGRSCITTHVLDALMTKRNSRLEIAPRRLPYSRTKGVPHLVWRKMDLSLRCT